MRIVLPFLGEFGWLIMEHIRLAYRLNDAIICCPKEHTPLFPKAVGFFHDYINPIKDANRCVSGSTIDKGLKGRFYTELRSRLKQLYPTCEVIELPFECRWHLSDAPDCKFKPVVSSQLPTVDITVAPRYREWDKSRNWPYWPFVCDALQKKGLRVGLIGSQTSSYYCPANVYAWNHSEGDLTGSIDLLNRSTLLVSIDSGMPHLAAMMDVPTVLIDSYAVTDEYGPMKRANRQSIDIISREYWNYPSILVEFVYQRYLYEKQRKQQQSKIGVCCIGTDEMAKERCLTMQSLKDYCNRHKYVLHYLTRSYCESRPPAWSKVQLLLDNLHAHDWLWWIDVDAKVTNPTVKLEEIINDSGYDLLIAEDNLGINTGSFFIRNCDWSRDFLQRVWALGPDPKHHWWEQWAFIRLLRDETDKQHVGIIPKRLINSYPNDWQTGDFIYHAAGYRGNERVKLLERIGGV